MSRTLFVGRFQPPHLGHKAMFDAVLPSKPLILIRPCPRSAKNPYTQTQVTMMLLAMCPDAIVDVLPTDIESIAYGRDVGYDVKKVEVDSPISATEIRRRIKVGEALDGLVHPSVASILLRITPID